MPNAENIIPPPPPQLPNLVSSRTKISPSETSFKIQLSEALWAKDDPNLQRACYFGRVCLYSSPHEFKYNSQIKGILQVGPTCGLTAISMFMEGNVAADELLEKSKAKGFTNNGEMFSTYNFYKILSEELQCCSKRNETKVWTGPLDCDEIRNELKQGSFLFVAYDADVNHAPARMNGHKAHWALVIGYLIDTENKWYVLARHGKSRNLAAWSLKDLSDSNMNLFEFKQPKEHPNEVFLLPEGGISGPLGLRGSSVLVRENN